MSTLTIEETNTLEEQINNLEEAKKEVVKNRDALEANLSKINKIINTLKHCIEDAKAK